VTATVTPDVLAVQHDVLDRRQACALWSPAVVRRRIAAGVWQQPHRRVVVCHNGPLSDEQRLWALLLSGPPGSALAGYSALAFDGMPEARTAPGHLVVPGGRRPPHAPGARVVLSRVLGPEDVHPHRQPRRTRPARSLVDAAIGCVHAGAARLVLIRGSQAGVARPGQLTDALARRGQCHHLAVLTETIGDLGGGVRSLPEKRFGELVRRAGLPPPRRQAPVRTPDGRYYLDAEWPQIGLAAEVHGVHHAHVDQLESDWVRHNELTLRGRRVLHFTSFAVRHRGDAVVATLQRASGPAS
jgi:hypothetical protein